MTLPCKCRHFSFGHNQVKGVDELKEVTNLDYDIRFYHSKSSENKDEITQMISQTLKHYVFQGRVPKCVAIQLTLLFI